MRVRVATEADLARILAIYERARAFMAASGNPLQWGPTAWPPEALVRADIAAGKSHVCVGDGGEVLGTFFFDQGEDVEPTYRHIEDGSWMADGPYGVVHRIASALTVKGVGSFCLTWALGQCGHLRIDTHPDNRVMRNLLAKLGFSRRGIVHVEENAMPRIAYEKLV